MNVIEVIKNILQALYTIGLLQLYAFLWPPQATVQDGAKFDFIVVGAGTAGSVIAARLAEDQKTSVLLIEAGGDPPDESQVPGLLIFLEKSYVDWNYTSEYGSQTAGCHENRVIDLMLGKMLGGTSSLNYLMASTGHYRDYNNWARIVRDDIWSWPQVRPYFVKATDLRNESASQTSNKYFGHKGPVGLTIDAHTNFNQLYLNAFKEAGNKIVLESNPEQTIGYARAMYNIADGVRQSSAYCYLSPFKSYSNLHVLKKTVAKKILFDSKKNAVGVAVVAEDGTTMILKSRKEVIISCGAVKSPQLLMLSGIGPKKHLESMGIEVISDLPVGKNFQDHVETILIFNMTKLKNSDTPRDPKEYPAESVVGYANTDKTKDYPLYYACNWINQSPFLVQFCRWTYGITEELCEALFKPNTSPMVWTVLSNLRPKSRGKVSLRSTDYTDAPIVQGGYYSNKIDLENQVKYIKDFIRFADTPSFKGAGGKFVVPNAACCDKYVFESTDYWRCYAKCMLNAKRNYCGTNAMGSVVDSRLRVKGVKRLRVSDASVVPVIPSADLYLPVIMIGEKTADMIKEDCKRLH